MVTSRVGRGGRTTIPRAVRDTLGITIGDELAYEIEGDRVGLERCSGAEVDDTFSVFTEWSSDADREAYANL